MADNNTIAPNAALLSTAITKLTEAFDAGVKAEGAIYSTVKALSFLAVEKAGREMLEGTWEMKTSKAWATPYGMVQKRLILSGKRIYRDSDALFAEHVKGKKGDDRIKGVNKYIAACKDRKGNDVVFTVAEVSRLGRKVLKDAIDHHVDDVKTIAAIESTEGQFDMFERFFASHYGETYRELRAAFKVEGQAQAPGAAILKSIAKLDDVEVLARIIAEATARLETVKTDMAKADHVLPVATVEDEGKYDDEVVVPFKVAA